MHIGTPWSSCHPHIPCGVYTPINEVCEPILLRRIQSWYQGRNRRSNFESMISGKTPAFQAPVTWCPSLQVSPPQAEAAGPNSFHVSFVNVNSETRKGISTGVRLNIWVHPHPTSWWSRVEGSMYISSKVIQRKLHFCTSYTLNPNKIMPYQEAPHSPPAEYQSATLPQTMSKHSLSP